MATFNAGFYVETNQDADYAIDWTTIFGVGQSFFNVTPATLDSCKIYLKKTGVPTGNVTAKIFAHAGTYGTSSVPTGAALATSANLDVSTLTGSYVLKTLSFTGANRIPLEANTRYVLLLDGLNTFTTVDCISAGGDTSTPSHPGNAIKTTTSNGTTWAADTGDLCFYVVAEEIRTVPVRNLSTGSTVTSVYARKRAPVNLKLGAWPAPAKTRVLGVNRPARQVFSKNLKKFTQ